MIQSFACPETRALFESRLVKKFGNFERVARRKLLMLNAATQLKDLRIHPGNRLEALQGDRLGQYSIRINRHGGSASIGSKTEHMLSRL